MNESVQEVLTFVEENDVKFIRLAFCDNFGIQKNISLQPGELVRAFESGIPFQASYIDGFAVKPGTRLLLKPDARTLAVIPWRPSQGRVVRMFCDVMNADGTPYAGDTRAMLQSAVEDALKKGYTVRIGSACEFYLFKTDENGKALVVPFDEGGFFDLAPADRGENVRRGICLTLYDMNIIPESSHHSAGPGQNEVVFRSSDALSAADNFVTFKSVVKQNAASSGLYASFMPKPLMTGKSNMLTLDIEIYKDGKNIFDDKMLEPEACSFVTGILEKLPELTAFLKPSTNSFSEDSKRVLGWSNVRGTYSVCIPAIKGIHGRMELTALDPSINPHLVYALLIRAGLDGIERELTLPVMEKSEGRIPSTLKQAVAAASKSKFVKTCVGKEVLANFLSRETDAIEGYSKARKKSDFEHDYYFKSL